MRKKYIFHFFLIMLFFFILCLMIWIYELKKVFSFMILL